MLFWLAMLATTLAANVRWTGNAQDVAQVSTIAASGTWATGDTATVTCNKKSVTVTVGTAVTTADVVAALAAAINATSATADLVGDETRNVGGQQILEFTEIVASASGSTLTLASVTPGIPFTVTRGEATAGSGALGAVTAVTAATGKHWLNNADNYEGGALPSDGDSLYVDAGGVSILYGLDYFRANSVGVDLIVSTDFTGSIGRPLLTAAGYQDYRLPRYLLFEGDSKDIDFIPGVLGVSPQGSVWIDLQDQELVDVTVAATRGSGLAPNIFIAGADASNLTNRLTVSSGSVAIEPDEAATDPAKFAAFSGIVVGTPAGDPSDARVFIGRNAQLCMTSTIAVHSGVLTTYAGTEVATDQAVTTIYGGEFHTLAAGDNYSFDVRSGGSLYIKGSGTFDAITLRGGRLDLSQATATQAINVLKAYAGSSIIDPNDRGVNGFDMVGCTLSQLTLDLPANRLLDFSAPATP